MFRFRSFLSLLAPLVLCAIFTGCGIGKTSTTNTFPMATISGKVHGGQQPISGAQVYLYAANTTTASYGGAPTSLLNSPGYVTTDADGNFSFNGAYSLSACQTANQLVYVVSVGGNPGAGSNNSNAVLMAALGSCANLTASTFVYLNEVTTVASVYALQQFMSPGTYNVGTTSTNLTGLQNAFLTVSNLVDLTTGVAYSQLPTLSPNNFRVAPQMQVNSLANALAACVNSATPFAACGSLYSAATPTNGTAPADTLGAILNIALHPAQNVSTLYTLPPPAAAFEPALTAQPNDWTLGLYYGRTGTQYAEASSVAIDAAGDPWIGYFVGGGLEYSPIGVSFPQDVYIAQRLPDDQFQSVTITPSGAIWFNDYQFDSSGVYVSHTSSQFDSNVNQFQNASDASGLVYIANGNLTAINPAGQGTTLPTSGVGITLAIDYADNIWMPSYAGTVLEATSSGALIASEPTIGWSIGPPAAYPLSYSNTAIAMDHEGDAWIRYTINSQTTSTSTSSLVEVSPTGASLIGNGSITLPDLGTNALAIDGADTVWVPNRQGGLSHFDHTGALISSAAGYQNAAVATVYSGSLSVAGLALDSSGNAWTISNNLGYLMELIGVAAPVATPLAANLVNNSIGQRP
jgi:hypothetical protein